MRSGTVAPAHVDERRPDPELPGSRNRAMRELLARQRPPLWRRALDIARAAVGRAVEV